MKDLSLQLVTAGHIHFSYDVDSEECCDLFNFYDNNVALINRRALTGGYVEFEANLTAGYPYNYNLLKFFYVYNTSRVEMAIFQRPIRVQLFRWRFHA